VCDSGPALNDATGRCTLGRTGLGPLARSMPWIAMPWVVMAIGRIGHDRCPPQSTAFLAHPRQPCAWTAHLPTIPGRRPASRLRGSLVYGWWFHSRDCAALRGPPAAVDGGARAPQKVVPEFCTIIDYTPLTLPFNLSRPSGLALPFPAPRYQVEYHHSPRRVECMRVHPLVSSRLLNQDPPCLLVPPHRKAFPPVRN